MIEHIERDFTISTENQKKKIKEQFQTSGKSITYMFSDGKYIHVFYNKVQEENSDDESLL